MARIKYFLFAIIISSAISTSIQYKYENCTNLRNGGKLVNHIMYLYSEKSFAPQCKTVNYSSLTEKEQEKILDGHKKCRAQSTNVTGPLEWDDELATIAQRWANQCQISDNNCRNIRGLEVRQIIGQISNPKRFLEFSEVVDVMYYSLDHYDFYYPFLRWANTTHVGCGGVKYTNSTISLVTHLVCNYLSKNDTNHKHVQSTSRPESSVTGNIDDRIRPDCKYDKCKDLSRSGEYHTHTMCRYPDLTVAAECNDVQNSSLTTEEKDEILKLHNDQRQSDDESLGTLRWNDELAVVAQRWANQCRVSHDECRDVNAESRVGQNIGMLGEKSSFVYEFSDIVYQWNSGFELQNPESDSNLQIQDSDKPYAQIVSGNTTEVGCGGIKYVDTQGYFNTYLVCNYQPSVRSGLAVVRDIHGSFGTH